MTFFRRVLLPMVFATAAAAVAAGGNSVSSAVSGQDGYRYLSL
jgi:hypothetical protein